MILVTGATGNVGREVVSQLLAVGQPVRALARGAANSVPPGVEVYNGDLNQPETLRNSLKGVSSVFLLGGNRDMTGLMAEFRLAGVERVILLSSRSIIGGQESNAIVKMWMTSEAAVKSSGIHWTILQPSSFMSNVLRWLPQLRTGNIVRAPFRDIPIALIDPFDIAAVASLALTTEEHSDRSYVLSGPEALVPEHQVQVLAKILRRPLAFEAQSDFEARVDLQKQFPEPIAEAMFRFYAEGEFDDSTIVPTISDLTGRPPRRLEDWASAHINQLQDAQTGS